MPAATVLLVEDDDSIALIVDTILTGAGYRVMQARSADEALVLAGEIPPAILVSDLNLPGGMGGDALALALRETVPTLGIVLISGDFEDSSRRDDLVPGAIILPKPFRRAELMAALAETGCEAS